MSVSNDHRAKMRANLISKLSRLGLTDEEIFDMESGIYEASRNVTCYTTQAKIIYLHLTSENNYLLPAVRDGRLTFRSMGFMSESEMNPEKWQSAMNKIAEAKQVSHGPQVVPSDIIKCRCGGQTTFTESQTRSCDEAMTIKATCLKCGKRFNI
jgi:DNA-directed RNA polymerase subunit M/transcription elongation factor TFIIS